MTAWAGPIEFTAGEVIWILVILAALFLAIPTLIGLAVMFRHRAAAEHPTAGSSAKHFFIGLAVTALIQAGVLAVASAIQN